MLYSKVIQLYIYLYTFFLKTIIFHNGLSEDSECINSSQCYNSMILSFIHSIYKSLHLRPNQCSSPWQPSGCSLCLWFYFSLIDRFICCILDSYKWYHMVFFFIFLTLFFLLTMIISSYIHVAAMVLFSSFLWLSSVPLYICTMASLSIHLLMDIYILSLSWLLWIVLLWT